MGGAVGKGLGSAVGDVDGDGVGVGVGTVVVGIVVGTGVGDKDGAGVGVSVGMAVVGLFVTQHVCGHRRWISGSPLPHSFLNDTHAIGSRSDPHGVGELLGAAVGIRAASGFRNEMASSSERGGVTENPARKHKQATQYRVEYIM